MVHPMMARTAVQSRLNHLERSAYLLALAGPQTSAFLQAEYTRLLLENSITPSENRANEVCGSCGTIMLPGLTAKIRKGEDRVGSLHNRTETQSTDLSRRLLGRRAHICYRCSSVTKYSATSKDTIPSIKSLPQLSDERATAVTSNGQVSGQTLKRKEYDSTVRNKNSKIRAKARKKSSLQEMLAKSKMDAAAASQNIGFGVDLMDFMKKS